MKAAAASGFARITSESQPLGINLNWTGDESAAYVAELFPVIDALMRSKGGPAAITPFHFLKGKGRKVVLAEGSDGLSLQQYIGPNRSLPNRWLYLSESQPFMDEALVTFVNSDPLYDQH